MFQTIRHTSELFASFHQNGAQFSMLEDEDFCE